MKKVLLLLVLAGLFTNNAAQAQKKQTKKHAGAQTDGATANAAKDSLLPYQRNPNFPIFKMQEMDSVTMFNTSNIPEGKPVLLFYFGPECDHCQKLVEKLLPGIDSLSDVRIYMVTFANVTPLKNFYERYHLAQYKNIQMGKDYDYFLGPFYGARSVPYLAMYDKHKKFVKKWEGTSSIQELYTAAFKK